MSLLGGPGCARGHRLRVLIATVLALVLAATVSGCLFSSKGEKEASTPRLSASARVTVKDGASVATPDGAVVVKVPAGAVDGSGTLSIEAATGAGGTHGWQVDLAGTTLTGTATMRFKVPKREKGEPAPLLRWAHSPTGRLAVAGDTRLEGDTLVVSTTHFSFWVLDSWGKLLDEASGWLRSRLDDASRFTASGKEPHCDGEAAARSAGWRVTSDSGRRVFWCLGLSSGKPVLKVVNARAYGVTSESTPGLRVTETDMPDFLGTLTNLMKPPPLKKGNSVHLIGSRNAVTYVLDDPVLAGVEVDPDAGAYLLSAMQYAVETFTMVTSKLGASKATQKLLVALNGEKCLKSLVGMATTELKTPSEVTNFFNDALGASFDCVAETIDDIDLGPILNLVVAPLVWLLTGLADVAHGLIAVGDMLLDFNGYQIIVHPPAIPATTKTVIDPFTGRGGLQPGWRLDRSYDDPSNPVDCNADLNPADQPSPHAVGPGTHGAAAPQMPRTRAGSARRHSPKCGA